MRKYFVLAALAGLTALPALVSRADDVKPAPPAAASGAGASGASSVEEAFMARVQEKVLANGLRVLVLPRKEAPTVSFTTMANVGGVDEKVGITGVAHIFEHMAFKGSTEIGTLDYAAEQAINEKLDAAFEKLVHARTTGAPAVEVLALETAFHALEAEAGKLVVNNEYSVILEENGGSGLNASTNNDTTQYYVSLPSNKLELWFQLEADRFETPVLREFYKEKAVVHEERRMRTDSSPSGRLYEEFMGVAFKAHPYGYPVIGWPSDIANLRRREAAEFYRTYYAPNNLTVAVVGNVEPARVFELAEKYMSRWKRQEPPRPVETEEPPQNGERRVEIEAPSGAQVMIGWHKCSGKGADEPAFDVMARILGSGGGRRGGGGGGSSRFARSLVKEKQVALSASADSDDPGVKYPTLFVVSGQVAIGKTADELEAALLEEVEKLAKEPVTEQELARVKRQARAGLVRSLGSNSGLAQRLCRAQTILGDWREAFTEIKKFEAVTADDVLRVAKKTFTRENRVVGRAVPRAGGGDGEGGGPRRRRGGAPGEGAGQGQGNEGKSGEGK